MSKYVGTTSRGIRMPIIKKGDNLANIVVENLLLASKNEPFPIKDRDVIAITESVVARSQGNYASIDDIAQDVHNKFGDGPLGVIFPILSRNRFSILLKGMARGVKKIIVMLSYPSDEVGNALITADQVYEAGINPYSDVLSLEKYRDLFGYRVHEFTGVDYVDYYKKLIEEQGAEAVIIFANRAEAILNYTKKILTCDIHTRFATKRLLKDKGAELVLALDDILNAPVDGSGYNEKYGLLGSNKATEETVKLFPRDGQPLVEAVQADLLEKTGKHFEVMVYGDGAFKDPQGKIWELADPVVSPFHTVGLKGTPNELKLKYLALKGTPNELKLKYLADNAYKGLKGKELADAIKEDIKAKEKDLVGKMASEGTTPRQITDLLGSLCDLTSGSGDKGTPVVLIQGYFDNYADE